MFDKIIGLKPELNPISIKFDYEQAATNAVKKIFLQTAINGCFFNFCQSMWRRIQNTDLSIKYHKDLEFSLNIKILTALAYVPQNLLKMFSKTY